MKVYIFSIVFVCAMSLSAMADDRYVSTLKLPTGETIVVAEGDYEARSIGSFSVRLYESASPPDETTFFISGSIYPREGSVEQILLADIDGDLQQEIIVIIRSVGTGNYQSVFAFSIEDGKVSYLASLNGLDANADPVKALKK